MTCCCHSACRLDRSPVHHREAYRQTTIHLTTVPPFNSTYTLIFILRAYSLTWNVYHQDTCGYLQCACHCLFHDHPPYCWPVGFRQPLASCSGTTERGQHSCAGRHNTEFMLMDALIPPCDSRVQVQIKATGLKDFS